MIGGSLFKDRTQEGDCACALVLELTHYGVPNALADPTLELHNGTGL